MFIHIHISEITCRRCSRTTAPRPLLVRPRDERNRNAPGHAAHDDHGGEWLVTVETPPGWSQLLDDAKAMLCPECTVGLNATVAVYLRAGDPVIEAETSRSVGAAIPQPAVPPAVIRQALPQAAAAPKTQPIPQRADAHAPTIVSQPITVAPIPQPIPVAARQNSQVSETAIAQLPAPALPIPQPAKN